MSAYNPELLDVENRLRGELRRVRLVFELGFPDDLVVAARSVVEQSRRDGALLRSGSIRYPACFVLTVVAAARTYNGHGFWDRDEFRFTNLRPNELADHTYDSFQRIGLETFAEFTRAENALRKLTPVLMHAGVAAPNVDELVRLITTAGRQHLFGSEEQIAAWSRTPNGFRGLWRASQLLFKYGGPIALDLLDRFNEALGSGDPSRSGLPTHLLAALDGLDSELVRAATRGRGSTIARPVVMLDPWSCDGPMIRVHRTSPEMVTRWRITGSEFGEIPARQADFSLPLEPQRDWEAVALRNGATIARWLLPAFTDLPVILFDGRSGQLLKMRGGQRELDSPTVLALLHPKVAITDTVPVVAEFPGPIGKWSDWRIVELDARRLSALSFHQIDGAATETLSLVLPPRRPELVGDPVPGVRTTAGTAVYSAPPILRVDLGNVEPDAVEVDVTAPTGTTTATLRQLGSGPDYDLTPIVADHTTFTVRVRGPLGLRLAATDVAVVNGLSIDTKPAIAFADDLVRTELTWPGGSTVISYANRTSTSTTAIDGLDVTVDIERVGWALREHGDAAAAIGHDPVLIAVDDLNASTPPVLSLVIGAQVMSRLELRNGSKTLQVIDAPHPTDRWTAALERLADTVRSEPAPSLELFLTVGSRSTQVGRIISQYVPTISDVSCDPMISPPVIEASLRENRPFLGRVARLWNLDRPWEPGIRIAIPDDERSTLLLRLPPTQRSGKYRLWLRIEDPWATTPRLPSPATTGVVDVTVSSGTPLDPDDPLDRIIGTLRQVPGLTPTDDDLVSHGHYLLAHVTQGLRDGGRAWLTTPLAGRALNLLERVPEALPELLTRAIREDWIDRHTAATLTIGLLPSLLQLEHDIDLSLSADSAESMWTNLPLAAATIESWSDSPEACERWARHVGWPRLTEQADMTGEQQLIIDIEPLKLLDTRFRDQIRIASMSSEFASIMAALGTLNEQPLSLDARLKAIIDVILSSWDRPYATWLGRHSPTVGAAHRRLNNAATAAWVESLSLDATPAKRGLFTDIAALAAAITQPDAAVIELRSALLDAHDFAPGWVTHCLMQALAFDSARHHGPLALSATTEDTHAHP